MSFINKVVIVTGGSAGIGAATVVKLAREGAKVVVVGRSEEKLNEVGKQCQSLNADYLIVRADITIENDLNRIVEETVRKYGQIDVLINNAGIFRKCSIMNGETQKYFDEVITTNLKSVVVLTSIAAPYLVKTKGNIVNISSIVGSHLKVTGYTTYAVSKAGMNMFTVGAALELAPYGVRVNCISPGPVRTNILQTSGAKVTTEDWKKLVALGRVSEPEEIADLILFLASDKAKGITGSNYVSDNGHSIR